MLILLKTNPISPRKIKFFPSSSLIMAHWVSSLPTLTWAQTYWNRKRKNTMDKMRHNKKESDNIYKTETSIKYSATISQLSSNEASLVNSWSNVHSNKLLEHPSTIFIMNKFKVYNLNRRNLPWTFPVYQMHWMRLSTKPNSQKNKNLINVIIIYHHANFIV